MSLNNVEEFKLLLPEKDILLEEFKLITSRERYILAFQGSIITMTEEIISFEILVLKKTVHFLIYSNFTINLGNFRIIVFGIRKNWIYLHVYNYTSISNSVKGNSNVFMSIKIETFKPMNQIFLANYQYSFFLHLADGKMDFSVF